MILAAAFRLVDISFILAPDFGKTHYMGIDTLTFRGLIAGVAFLASRLVLQAHTGNAQIK